jgi:hypothetical protein
VGTVPEKEVVEPAPEPDDPEFLLLLPHAEATTATVARTAMKLSRSLGVECT